MKTMMFMVVNHIQLLLYSLGLKRMLRAQRPTEAEFVVVEIIVRGAYKKTLTTSQYHKVRV